MATPNIQVATPQFGANTLSQAFIGGGQVGVSAANVRQRAVEAAVNAQLARERMQLQAQEAAARQELIRDQMREDRIARAAQMAAQMQSQLREIQAQKDLVEVKAEAQGKLQAEAARLDSMSDRGQMDSIRLAAMKAVQKQLEDPEADPAKVLSGKPAVLAFSGTPGYLGYLTQQAERAALKDATMGGNFLTMSQRTTLQTKKDELEATAEGIEAWKNGMTEDQRLNNEEEIIKQNRIKAAAELEAKKIGRRLGIKEEPKPERQTGTFKANKGWTDVELRDGSKVNITSADQVAELYRSNQFSADPEQNRALAEQYASAWMKREGKKPAPTAAAAPATRPPALPELSNIH